MKHKKLTLAIDFDDTIALNSGKSFPNLENVEPRKGAIEFVNKLYDDGHYIIIWTCRHGDACHLAEIFLNKHGIRYHAINRHNPEIILKYQNDTRKISADIYIDDKNLGDPPEWEDIYQLIKSEVEQ